MFSVVPTPEIGVPTLNGDLEQRTATRLSQVVRSLVGPKVGCYGHLVSRLLKAAISGVLFSALLGAGCDDPEPAGTPAPEGPWEVAVEADASVGAFLSVWGPAPNEVWAVGGQVANVTDAGAGAIYRRDAGGWSAAAVPEGTPLLNWVHGTGDEVWAVGNAGAALRYDGSAWQVSETGIDVPLWGVYVFGPNEVWAVGGNAFERDVPGIIIRYDGSSWSETPLPELDRDSAAIFKIFGFSPNDIHAVGASGVILHYDGSGTEALADVIAEMLIARTSERQGRVIDHDGDGSMEEKKKEGYF